MKKIIPLLTCLILAGCSVQKVKKDYTPYNDVLNFKILTITSSKFSEGVPGDRVDYIGIGGRFKMAVIAVNNKSGEEQTINFEDFKLLDDEGKEYTVISVSQSMKLSLISEKIFKIGAGKKRTFMAEFWPLFPKGQEVKRIVVKGKEISIQ